MDTTAAASPPPLRAHLLGPVRITVGERPISDRAWPRRTARTLLLLLLATPGHRLPRDRVLDLLWPETTPEAAPNTLSVALHGLRRVLEPDLRTGRASAYLEGAGNVIALRTGAGLWVDIDAFESKLALAEASSPAERAACLREALALYSGDLLADEPYVDWPVARREQLRAARRRATLELSHLDVDAGQPLASVAAVEALLVDDPTDEAAHRALMFAHAVAGQRDEALRQYERCIALLRDELGVEPSAETAALAAEIRSTVAIQPILLPSDLANRHFDNLPAPPTPLVGRARELEALQDLLLDSAVRLVTVTGAGGIGKTRLALETARHAAGEFANGVCFVDLAAVRDPALVVPTIARTLGVEAVAGRPIADVLTDAIRDWDLLLVLDNLEQVLDAAPQVAELLMACMHLKILTTSREPLHLRAEHLFDTPTLPLPDPDRPPAAIARYEAVRLFVDRARAVHAGFTISDENAAIVAAICARLDGLPLAIELAAARCRALSPERVLQGLEDRFQLLSAGYRDLPPRHRTMRDAIAWSHDLLTPGEQMLFRRLAVFAGGCPLEAVEAIYAAMGSGRVEVWEGLAALADQSLVLLPEDAAAPRYGMLETIREFALEQLAASGEEEAVRRAHAAHYVALAEQAEPALTGPDQAAWSDRLEIEHDNFRATLGRALDRSEIDVALRLGAALGRFWLTRGYFFEGRDWLTRALAADAEVPLPMRAAALTAAGSLAEHQNDYAPAEALHGEALAAWRQLGDRRRTAAALGSLGNVAQDRGDYGRAVELHEQALALCREIGDRWGVTRALNGLGIVAYYQGAYDRAAAFWTEALAGMREIGDSHSACQLMNNLGALAFQRGDLAQAAALHEETLALRRAMGDRQGVASSLINLGEIAQQLGDLERAVVLLEEGVRLLRDLGDDRQIAIALLTLVLIAREHRGATRAEDLVRESVALFHRTGDQLGLAGALEAAAGIRTSQGKSRSGVLLFAASAALRQAIGGAREAGARATYDRDLATAREALGDEAFAAAWTLGSTLAPAEAVAEAQAVDPAVEPNCPLERSNGSNL